MVNEHIFDVAHLLALLCSVAAVSAASWYLRRSRPNERDGVPPFDVVMDPQAEPQVEPHVEPNAPPQAELHVAPQAEPHEAPVQQQPALPNWMSASSDALVAHVAAHRGVNYDWRHLHEAAKAGRFDVVSRFCHELHVSVLLTNMRGRNILHAAVSHNRHIFITWLAHCPADMEPKPPTYDQVAALFETPDATGRKPFLAAAARRDPACVRSMASDHLAWGLPTERARLGPPSTNREDFLEACAHIADDDSGTRALLVSELRRFDVCLRLRVEALDEERAEWERALWWPPNLEEEPWTPEEARSVYRILLACVASHRVDLAAWVLDDLHISPSPPAGTRWQGQRLCNHLRRPSWS